MMIKEMSVDCHCRVVSSPASDLGGPGFKSQSEAGYDERRFPQCSCLFR
jgi:hypothetical protein